MNKHYLIVLNPLPNKQKKYWLNWVIEQLKSKQLSYYIYTTSQVLTDNQLFFEKNLNKYEQVVVLGGDGTLHLIANCMAYAKQPITVLPCGTGNDFIRNFDYDRAQTKQLLFSKNSEAIDLGRINVRYFINSAGVGFDAEIVKKTAGNKGLLARFSYLYHTASCLFFYREKSLTLMQSSTTKEYPNFLTVFANGKFFGGGMKIAPDATLNSGQLTCYSIEKASLFKKIWALTKIYSGKHTQLKEVCHVSFNRIEVKTQGLTIQADGEIAGQTPAIVEVAQGALRVKVI